MSFASRILLKFFLGAILLVSFVAKAELDASESYLLRWAGDSAPECRVVLGELVHPGEAYLLPQLKRASKQCFGDCEFKAFARAIEYVYEAVMGQPIEISTAYISLNKMRRTVIDMHVGHGFNIESVAPHSSVLVGLEQRARNITVRHGLLPEGTTLTEAMLPEIAAKIRALVEKYFEDKKVAPRTADFDGLVRLVDQLVDSAGGDKSQVIEVDGRKMTPILFSRNSFLDWLDWESIKVPGTSTYNKVQDDIVISSYEEFLSLNSLTVRPKGPLWGQRATYMSRNFANTLKTTNSILSFALEVWAHGLPIKVHVVMPEDLEGWYDYSRSVLRVPDHVTLAEIKAMRTAHALLWVGLARDRKGEYHAILQNSWGQTLWVLDRKSNQLKMSTRTEGEEGLIMMPVSSLIKSVLKIEVPGFRDPAKLSM